MAMPNFAEIFTYNPKTGHLFWALDNHLNGKRAGCLDKSKGYRRVRYNEKGYLEHRVIAELFLPKVEGKDYVNHKNGIKDDNRIENLEWCTQQENCIHAFETGLSIPRSLEDNPNSKLTKEQVLFCLENYKPRDRQFGARALARKFGVDKTTVANAVNGTTWKGVSYVS